MTLYRDCAVKGVKGTAADCQRPLHGSYSGFSADATWGQEDFDWMMKRRLISCEEQILETASRVYQ